LGGERGNGGLELGLGGEWGDGGLELLPALQRQLLFELPSEHPEGVLQLATRHRDRHIGGVHHHYTSPRSKARRRACAAPGAARGRASLLRSRACSCAGRLEKQRPTTRRR